MDSPSAQLTHDIRTALTHSLSTRRPLLHHLNADTSWLLQIPRPLAAASRGRQFYNILIDPWFRGRQVDIATWFSAQSHAEASSVQSITQVEDLARQIEILATELRVGKGGRRNGEELEEEEEGRSWIDVVAVSHEFTDHCHRETLLEVHPDVPVVAAKKAADLIRSWSHFRTVLDLPIFTGQSADWQATSIPPLPEWLGISRIVSPNEFVILHAALLITFSSSLCTPSSPSPLSQGASNGYGANGHHNQHDTTNDDDDEDTAEAIVYTPHGIPAAHLHCIPSAKPPIHTLAFLHGLHDVSVGLQQQINLGAHNGLKAQRILKARYWVPTHDEVKDGGGIVRWLLRRKQVTLEEALREEMKSKRVVSEEGIAEAIKDVGFAEVRNGESRTLY